MRFFSSRTHAVLDYLLALLLLVAAWLLGFADGGPAAWVPLSVGAALLLYSALTQYELGVVRRLDIPVHLWLDGAAGLLLALSPWLFGFDQRVWIPHLAAGVLLISLALLSDTVPGYDRRGRAEPGAR